MEQKQFDQKETPEPETEDKLVDDLKRSVSDLQSYFVSLQKSFVLMTGIMRHLLTEYAEKVQKAEEEAHELRGEVTSLKRELSSLRSDYDARGDEIVSLTQDLWNLANQTKPDLPTTTPLKQSHADAYSPEDV